ncbi:hypothetical protein HU200_063931 [Digitaria exilis]|uniref:Uncharacterized protein n=1 Tax=Digitaria exilis TaxID=1010633 RepID=A0A835A6U2_9POAL|nr:hypothetical protein HU200_063931 [Digitaria exilis]
MRAGNLSCASGASGVMVSDLATVVILNPVSERERQRQRHHPAQVAKSHHLPVSSFHAASFYPCTFRPGGRYPLLRSSRFISHAPSILDASNRQLGGWGTLLLLCAGFTDEPLQCIKSFNGTTINIKELEAGNTDCVEDTEYLEAWSIFVYSVKKEQALCWLATRFWYARCKQLFYSLLNRLFGNGRWCRGGHFALHLDGDL